MCVFCASIPAAVALGASARVRQNQHRKEAEAKGEKPAKLIFPAGAATAVVVVALVTGSVVVHTQLIR